MNKLIFLIILIFVPSIVFPCSFLPRTDEEYFKEARAVFRGKVVETRLSIIHNPANPKEKVKVVEGKVIVTEKFKGEPPPSGYVKDLVFGPGNCSLGLFAGMEYVFYLADNDFVLLPTGSFAFFNAEGSQVKIELEKLRELSRRKP